MLAVAADARWRDALIGAAGAVAPCSLLAGLASARSCSRRIPLDPLRVRDRRRAAAVQARWLRKGALRLAGRRAPSSALAEYVEEREALHALPLPRPDAPHWAARIVAGKGVLLEGIEVVLIVAALAAPPTGLAPALAGAGLAIVAVIAARLRRSTAARAAARVASQIRRRHPAQRVRRLLPRRGLGRRVAGRRPRAALPRRRSLRRVSQLQVTTLAREVPA